MKIDVVIPVKTSLVGLAIERTIPSVLSKLPCRSVLILTKRENFPKFISVFGDEIRVIDEDNVVDGLTIDKVADYLESKDVERERAGWYFQQFLKLGIAKTDLVSDLYLVWDADNVALRPISFFSDAKEVLYDTTYEYNKPYFEIIEKLIGIKRQVRYSFISEHLVFDKKIVLDLLSRISDEVWPDWWMGILRKIEPRNFMRSGFSEYELYGNFVAKFYSGCYKVRRLSKIRSGSFLLGMEPDSFDLSMFSLGFDSISFEGWQKKCRPLPLRYILILVVLFLAMCRNVVRGVFRKTLRLSKR